MKEKRQAHRVALGIDPGLTGGLALMEQGRAPEARPTPVHIAPMPVRARAYGKGREVDTLVLAATLADWYTSTPWHTQYIEAVSAHPGQGVTSVFQLGCAYAAARTVAEMVAGCPCGVVHPVRWKNALALKGFDKMQARGAVVDRWPWTAPLLGSPRSSGRSDAVWISLYALQQLEEEELSR